MPIEINPIEFEPEKTMDSATTRNRIDSVTPPASDRADSKSRGLRQDRRRVDEPRGACAIVHFLPGERRIRIAVTREIVDRPRSVVLTDGDGAVIRVEYDDDNEISEPEPADIQDPDTPGSSPSSSVGSVSIQPEDARVPLPLFDRRVPQRGWEREYGVPAYLIGAADVLYHHRKSVANTDAAVIDAAILRLFGPWIRRCALSSPIPQEVYPS